MAEIAEVSQYLWQKGWAECNAGNISVRITGHINDTWVEPFDTPGFVLPMPFRELSGEIFFMTGTGSRMRDIQAHPGKNLLIIRISEDGLNYQVISHSAAHLGTLRPTSELSSHLAIHQYLKNTKPEKKVVVHTHPNELIALTHSPLFKDEKAFNHMIWSMHPEAVVVLPDGAGLVPYVVTGSNELGLATLKSLENHDVVVWEKHGCLAVADEICKAFDLIDVISKSADIYLKCRTAGFEPEGLSEEQMEDLRRRFVK